jgi:hypothetical protein
MKKKERDLGSLISLIEIKESESKSLKRECFYKYQLAMT